MEPDDGPRLDRLEADIASVASAMETVDRIVAESDGGSAAAEIAAVVSPQRFPLPGEAAPPVSAPSPGSAPPLGSGPPTGSTPSPGSAAPLGSAPPPGPPDGPG